MKQLIIPAMLLIAATSAFAQYGMMGYGTGYTGYGWIFGLILFSLAAFLFSVIFWLTHKWIEKK